MRIAVTCRFQNSYFSGGLPQVAVLFGKALVAAGHEVTLLYPKGDRDWFIDVEALKAAAPPRQEVGEDMLGMQDRWDMVLEVAWSFPAEVRPRVADRIALFQHHPPMFHDMESSVYPFNNAKRDFVGVHAIWTWDHFGQQDLSYLRFLSGGKPVLTVPFTCDFDAIDCYVKETAVPAWTDSAKTMESRIPNTAPLSLSWSARIMESNASNTSHCLVPLNIVSEIRRVDPIRFSVHNGEHVISNAFFQSNIGKNLLLPDMSGNFVPRIRMPDLCREKSVVIAHQRFRPLKRFLIDALYLGIPLIHNCVALKGWGYWYDLNQIRDAVECWKTLTADYANQRGFFAAGAAETRKAALRSRFGYEVLTQALTKVIKEEKKKMLESPGPRMRIEEITTTAAASQPKTAEKPTLRVIFCDMWDQFQPEHNFFMSLFRWASTQHDFDVVYDPVTPNIMIYGPFGEMHTYAQYAKIPKVFFTGENLPPRKDHGTFLNLGYMYDPASDYIRLPLWVLEINWFGEDPAKIVNPRPLPLEDCLRAPTSAELAAKKKFCAFVATNPRCQNRNMAFHILNEWRGVDAGGRLFCNLPSGPVPAGLGGGGGELAKVDFYRDYKYVIAFENAAAPGYVTEKLFHAKAAGCVPIYWGDKFVDRDFDAKGFLNANTCETAEDLRRLVTKLEEEEGAWQRMAAIPALSEYKRHWCERTMEEVVKAVVRRVLSKDIQFAERAWTSSSKAANKEERKEDVGKPERVLGKKRIVTAANAPYIDSTVHLVRSAKRLELEAELAVYVWPDVSAEQREALKSVGAIVLDLPTDQTFGWKDPKDFWNPQHFAWKLWILKTEATASNCASNGASNGASNAVIYMDAGIEIVNSMKPMWDALVTHGCLWIEDPEQVNRTWCHPTFCSTLGVTEEELAAQQLWAGCVGFMGGDVGSRGVIEEAWAIASQKRDVIVGHKWQPYSATCKGHRHDQSILSLLTHRQKSPRVGLNTVYCDRARRTAELRGVPLYVHRGRPKILQPLQPGIDDGYVVNLERRKDRLASFRSNKDVADVHVLPAIDGRTLKLTPELASLFRNNDFKWKKSVMGCALSHFALWQRLAVDPVAKSYVIFEDDVRLRDDWAAQWYKAAAHVPADADAIYLGGVLPPNKAALPSITEPVNPFFARVAKNTLFGVPGAASRRYFHFCNYAYVLTKQGAQKLCQIIQERGIFTSGDHMIVNHGDGLLNIYFTTPLLAECIQENDPTYQRSDFNNFARLDTFDSDLWNNNDHFGQAEVTEALAVEMRKIDIRVVKEPLSDAERLKLEEEHAHKLGQTDGQTDGPKDVGTSNISAKMPLNREEKLKLWNDFLRAVAQKQQAGVANGLEAIFASWPTAEAIVTDMAWFRIFEQLILTDNEALRLHKDRIIAFIQAHGGTGAPAWGAIARHWGLTATREASPATAVFVGHDKATTVFYLKGADPATYLETEWYSRIFPGGIRWKEVATLGELLGAQVGHMPVLLYQNQPNASMVPSLRLILDKCGELGKQLVLLHMSDEFARDPVAGVYDHPAVKHVFRNYWRSDLSGLGADKVTVIPLGYANGRSGNGLGYKTPAFADRELVWSFVGSADRVGRKEALDQLRVVEPHVDVLKEGWSAPHAQDATTYVSTLRRSKFVPCMRGAKALESFRVYEALEAGAIPVYVPSESNGCADEFREMYGLSHPFLAIPSWSEAAQVLPKLAANPTVMEEHRERVGKWWSAKKAEVAAKIAKILASQ